MSKKRNNYLVYGVVTITLAAIVYLATSYIDQINQASPIVSTEVTDPGDEYSNGLEIYESNCAACHGIALGGVKGAGPPFIHSYYSPGHHSDTAFYRAIAQGVVAHHWQFGNMPPVPSLNREQSTDVIAYIRMVQRANGIN